LSVVISASGEAPVAILAGGGALPGDLARSLRAQGHRACILAFRGFAERSLLRQADAVLDLLDIHTILKTLHAWQPAAVTLAGTVHRPNPLAMMNAFAAFRSRDHIAELIASGDDSLLGTVVRLLEEQGLRVAGLDTLAPDLLAAAGPMSRLGPAPEAERSIGLGFEILTAIAPFDVGQAVVVCGARIAAIEGPEGTDAMLDRVRKLWRTSRLRKLEPGGVLAKTAKATQDLRVDLPVIGPRTVHRAAAARLTGIAVGAGRTLVVERERTIAEADRLGLFIVGIPQPGRNGGPA
jgi:UDP-2,3-diacylglucosamine hydrolase